MGHGGAREGAGRPPKTEVSGREYDRLDIFERRAVLGLRHRVPEGTHPVLAELADHAMMRLVDAMNEKIDPDHAPIVLKAVTAIREEICGIQERKVTLKVGLAQLLADATREDPALMAEDVTPELPEPMAEVLGRDPEDRREKAPARPEGPTGAGDDDA